MTILGSKLVIAKSFVLQKLLYVAMVCQNILLFINHIILTYILPDRFTLWMSIYIHNDVCKADKYKKEWMFQILRYVTYLFCP